MPSSSSSPTEPSSEAPILETYLDHPSYTCSKCCATIALQDEVISKAFSGREGRGFLIHIATNVRLGKREDRALMTGVHSVADVFCIGCNERVGWYYHKAADSSQKYKEGKYLLESEKLVKENMWKLDDADC